MWPLEYTLSIKNDYYIILHKQKKTETKFNLPKPNISTTIAFYHIIPLDKFKSSASCVLFMLFVALFVFFLQIANLVVFHLINALHETLYPLVIAFYHIISLDKAKSSHFCDEFMPFYVKFMPFCVIFMSFYVLTTFSTFFIKFIN